MLAGATIIGIIRLTNSTPTENVDGSQDNYVADDRVAAKLTKDNPKQNSRTTVKGVKPANHQPAPTSGALPSPDKVAGTAQEPLPPLSEQIKQAQEQLDDHHIQLANQLGMPIPRVIIGEQGQEEMPLIKAETSASTHTRRIDAKTFGNPPEVTDQ